MIVAIMERLRMYKYGHSIQKYLRNCLRKNIRRKALLDNLRTINNKFAAGSFKSLKYNHTTPGPPCERIYGQTYRFFNTALTPAVNEDPTFAQIVYIDTEQALDMRSHSLPASLKPYM